MDRYSTWADDYGYRKDVNEKINSLLKMKKMLGYSVLATHVGNKISINDPNKNTSVSLHVNLIEGIPVNDPVRVSSLVDRRGHFYPLWIFVARVALGLIKVKDLDKEVEAQYKKLIDLGLDISCIDSHQHIHALGIIYDSVKKVAKRYNLTIRNYGGVKAFTLRAKFMLTLVKATSYLLPPFCKFPGGWTKNGSGWFYMSWETAGFKNNIKDMGKNNILVTHPGRNVDRRRIIDY